MCKQIVNVLLFLVRLDSQKHSDFSQKLLLCGSSHGRVKRTLSKSLAVTTITKNKQCPCVTHVLLFNPSKIQAPRNINNDKMSMRIKPFILRSDTLLVKLRVSERDIATKEEVALPAASNVAPDSIGICVLPMVLKDSVGGMITRPSNPVL